jgi:hypothetical protein
MAISRRSRGLVDAVGRSLSQTKPSIMLIVSRKLWVSIRWRDLRPSLLRARHDGRLPAGKPDATSGLAGGHFT